MGIGNYTHKTGTQIQKCLRGSPWGHQGKAESVRVFPLLRFVSAFRNILGVHLTIKTNPCQCSAAVLKNPERLKAGPLWALQGLAHRRSHPRGPKRHVGVLPASPIMTFEPPSSTPSQMNRKSCIQWWWLSRRLLGIMYLLSTCAKAQKGPRGQ